jgi:hypothetical protein
MLEIQTFRYCKNRSSQPLNGTLNSGKWMYWSVDLKGLSFNSSFGLVAELLWMNEGNLYYYLQQGVKPSE